MRKFGYFLRGRLFPCALLFALIAGGTVALAILLPRLLAPVAVLERAFSLAVGLYVAAGRDLAERKISKLVLLFLPWMGAILCLFFRTEDAELAKISDNRGHGTLLSRLSCLSRSAGGAVMSGAERVEYFPVGSEMEARFLKDLSAAKERVFLEAYIIARGEFWENILAVLTKKAAEGLDVRVIFDGFGCSVTLPKDYPSELARAGIRSAVFRPPKVGRGFSRRDHRKLFLIDGVAYTGGLNLADEYVGKKIRFGHWKDTAVRIEGGVAPFYERFLRTWYALCPRDSVLAPIESKQGGVPFLPLFDGTDGGIRLFARALFLLIAGAGERCYLFTPYLSLPRELLSALKYAALAGVDVKLMIPHIPDKKAVFFLTRTYADELVRCGVDVREYTPGFLHAKEIVADGKYTLVSSCNLDFRSLYLQAECGALVESEPLAREAERDFLACWQQGAPCKRRRAFVRALGRLCMLFAPLT